MRISRKRFRLSGRKFWIGSTVNEHPWLNLDLNNETAAVGIGHVIWFLTECGYGEAAEAVENEFGVAV